MAGPSNNNDETINHGLGVEDIQPGDPTRHSTSSEKPVFEHTQTSDDDGSGWYAQVDPALAVKIAANVDDFMTLVNEANEANEREKDMKLLTAFKIYPKAICWSVILSSCLIMEGYEFHNVFPNDIAWTVSLKFASGADLTTLINSPEHVVVNSFTPYSTSVVGSYMAYPSFLNRFGQPTPTGMKTIPSDWQNGIKGATNVGEIIGLQLAGVMSERWGYRWTIIANLIAITGFIFFPFFAESLTVFLVGEFFQGLAWGAFQTMTVAYAAEVCPVPLRHCLTAYVNLCWIMGGFISSGILVGLVDRVDEWGYKIPFAIQWVWPIPIAIGTFLAPESPWWYVRTGQKDKAERSLKRLARSSGFSQREADAAMALMLYTDEMEKQTETGTKYWDCFKGIDLRRTEIVCMTWISQTMSGTVVAGLGAFFYQQAGISASDSFKLDWGKNALGALGTIASWFIMDRIGRKTLMFGGMCVMFVLLLITGFMGIHTPPTTAEAWAAGTMVVLLSAVSNFSVGPVVYTIVSEIPSTRLRAKSIILARNAYNAINIAFVNVVSYRQLNPGEWNWGPKAALFWAGINAIFSTYIYFRLPETKGRTYAELDILFENKVPARKFASTKIETLIKGTEGAQKEEAGRIIQSHEDAAKRQAST